jgi:ribA/ribD-fused uncharacterized protein
MSLDELKLFYMKWDKHPTRFGYDVDGNLVERNKEGEVIQTISLPNYRSPTYEEYDEMEKKRKEKIAQASKLFNDAKRTLRDLFQNPDTPCSKKLQQNEKVKIADIELQRARFPLQYVSIEDGIEVRSIDFSDPKNKRKINDSMKDRNFVSILQTNPFTLQEQYVRTGAPPKKPLISVQEAKENKEQQVPVILFAEPETNDYGFLSLSWVVNIEFQGTMYHSAKQAIYAEIAKGFQDDTHLQQIMIAETPDAIQYSVKDVPGEVDVNETKWNDMMNRLLFDVNLLKFKQYPELGQRLLETKQATLGAYLPNDNRIGIGISLDMVQSQNQMNWSGQNLLGKALMDIRKQLQLERDIALSSVAQPAPITTVKRKIRLPLAAKKNTAPPST